MIKHKTVLPTPMARRHTLLRAKRGLTSSPNFPNKRRLPHSWIGFRGKTLWDWLSIILIPIILAIYALLATVNVTEQQNTLINEQLKSQILQDYTTLIQNLILHEGLLQSKSGDNVRIIARTQTDQAFKQLDKDRKASLLHFISQLKLTNISDPFIDLRKLNFSGTDLSGTNLSGTDLNGANLYGANLYGANLYGANLYGVDLVAADLYGANLYGANLYGAELYGAELYGAYLYGVDLVGADLTWAYVTDQQLKQARTLQGATMPDGSIHP